jgi:hypothetical protein
VVVCPIAKKGNKINKIVVVVKKNLKFFIIVIIILPGGGYIRGGGIGSENLSLKIELSTGYPQVIHSLSTRLIYEQIELIFDGQEF